MRFKIKYCLVILCLQIVLLAKGQDFSFIWKMIPSLDYHVMTFKINEIDSKAILTLKESSSNDSTSVQILSSDVDSIYDILLNHQYRIQGNIFQDTSKRRYLPTKVLNDKWLIVNGDSIRKESIWIKGLEFDSDSNKCYDKVGYSVACTDGITYTGYFKTNKLDKSYSVHNCFLTAEECRINQMVLDLIKIFKLDNEFYYRYLQQAENCIPSKYMIENKQ
jgi:hypothetical protein